MKNSNLPGWHFSGDFTPAVGKNFERFRGERGLNKGSHETKYS
jgi:hypothetical protein